MPRLNEFILKLADVFDRLAIPYAFGGAVATSFWGTARFTHDADCLVSIPALQFETFADELQAMGCVVVEPEGETLAVTVPALRNQLDRRHYTTLSWNSIQADLFKPIVPLQDDILRRAVWQPLEDGQIKVATAEDLILLKMAFHRQKDIWDVQSVLYAQRGKLDLDYLRKAAVAVIDDPTLQELEALINEYCADDAN